MPRLLLDGSPFEPSTNSIFLRKCCLIRKNSLWLPFVRQYFRWFLNKSFLIFLDAINFWLRVTTCCEASKLVQIRNKGSTTYLNHWSSKLTIETRVHRKLWVNYFYRLNLLHQFLPRQTLGNLGLDY
jgi:hypothetical protein